MSKVFANAARPVKELTKENHQGFFERFMQRRDTQLPRFVDALNSEYGEGTLDFTPESLDRAWDVVKANLSIESLPSGYTDEARVPEWVWFFGFWLYVDETSQTLSYESLDWIDQLVYYVGEVVIRTIPNTRWIQCVDVDIKSPSTTDYWIGVANYERDGKARREGYLQYIYIYIRGCISKHFKGEETSLKMGYDLYLTSYHGFLKLSDEEKYGSTKKTSMMSVEGRKKKSDWLGDAEVLTATKGYYDVWVDESAESELGDAFEGLGKTFEALDEIEHVIWTDRECMQIATMLTKKKLEKSLNACFEQLKQSAESS